MTLFKPSVILANSTVIIPVQQLNTLTEVEKCLNSILAAKSGCNLQMASELRSYQFGVAAATLQLLITWGQRHHDGVLITYLQPGNDAADHYTKLAAGYTHGLIGLLTAPHIATLNQDLTTHLARAKAIQFLEQSRAGLHSARFGNEILLVSYDDQPDLFPRPLYDRPSKPKGIADFEILFSEVEELIVRRSRANRIDRRSVTNIGVILKELFWNTHEWARRDLNDVAIPRSVRVIRCIYYEGKTEALLATVGNSEALRKYLLNPWPQSDIGFLEISVLDSGIGLAQRRTLRPLSSMSLADEYAAVVHCLLLRSTSSSESHRGIGLHVVLRTLTDLGGFLRVRCGRLALQRDFVRSPYLLTKESLNSEVFLKPSDGEPYLLDWQTDDVADYTAFAPVSGVLLTMLIPIALPVRLRV